MGIFSSSSGSFGAGVFTGNSLGNRHRPKKSYDDKPAVGDLDGTRAQGHNHSKRSFQPD